MSWMPPALQWPDAELVMCQAIRAQLLARPEAVASGVFVGNHVPPDRRARMVIVRRDGGTPTGVVDRPLLTLRCWAESQQDAVDLGRLVQALAKKLPGQSGITRVETPSGVIRLPDESEQPSVYLTVVVHLRGAQL